MIHVITLWLFVIFLGIAFGAGLYESRVVVPNWISSGGWNADAARRDDPGRKFWIAVTTIPLTLLTLVSLPLAWQASAPLRIWWLVAAVAALADRVFTFSYFIPTMVGLMTTGDSPESRTIASRWARLGYARIAIMLVAWLAALRAFSLCA